MKKKKNYLIFSIIVICLLTIFSISLLAQSSGITVIQAWGRILKANSDSVTDSTGAVFAQGNHSVVLEKDVNQAAQMYKLAGMNEEEARKAAEEYMLEYEAMYTKAINAGFQVTDEEVHAYLNDLKEFLKEANNQDEIQAIISEFDTEEDYWNYQFEVYKKSLPIQKYNAYLEKSFMNSQSSKGNMSTEDLAEAWAKHFSEIKADAVEDENYSIKIAK